MTGGDGISVIAEGVSEPARFEALAKRVEELQVIEAPAGSTSSASKLNPLVDDARFHWILVLREREVVSEPLATEIAGSATGDPKAWGYRIATRAVYCGRPLLLGRNEAGEVRLFHRRKARLQPDGRMKVQGTVVRLRSVMNVVLYESEAQHREALEIGDRTRVGAFARVARWASAMIRHAPRSFDASMSRFLWIEAEWRGDT